jgi:dolichol-phosphate mannosyltransferase
MKKALFVIPSYNEKENIRKLVPQIFSIVKPIENWDIHILVVDDNSPDKTADEVKILQKTYKNLHLLMGQKEGLGKAYTRGFEWGKNNIRPFVFFEMDADLQHDPKEIPHFLKKIEQGADFVIGSRYIKGGSIPQAWGIMRKIYSIPGNFVIRLGFMKLSITDWTGGYRAIKSWVIEKADAHIKKYNGYVFQMALLDFAIKQDAKIAEIPIQFLERTDGESKINSSSYIKSIFLYILTQSPFVKFVIVGLIGFFFDFSISFILIELLHVQIVISTVISAEVAIISNFLLNNFWSFSHKKIESGRGIMINKFIKFNSISVGSIVIQAAALFILTSLFSPQWWFIYKVLVIFLLIIPYSYFMYNRLVWKKK